MFSAIKIQEFRTGATKNNLETIHSKEENKKLKSSLIDLRERLSSLEGQNLGLQRDIGSVRHDSEIKEREMERENEQLKSDVAKLRAEIDAVMMELQHIMDSKVNLELEIAAYRKLLEGEEHRLVEMETHLGKSRSGGEGSPYSANVDSTYGGNARAGYGGSDNTPNEQRSYNQYSSTSRSSSRAGDSPRYSYQRSSKGTCGIAESSADGKFIVLENNGRKDEDLGAWVIKRIVNGADQLEYVFDVKLILKSNSKVKIWSRGNKPSGAPYTDVEAKVTNWGVGDNVVTKLMSPSGEERATYTQKIAN